MIKMTIKIGLTVIFIGGVLFAAILSGLGESLLQIREVITYIPLEYRVGIYIMFGGLVFAFGKSFIK